MTHSANHDHLLDGSSGVKPAAILRFFSAHPKIGTAMCVVAVVAGAISVRQAQFVPSESMESAIDVHLSFPAASPLEVEVEVAKVEEILVAVSSLGDIRSVISPDGTASIHASSRRPVPSELIESLRDRIKEVVSSGTVDISEARAPHHVADVVVTAPEGFNLAEYCEELTQRLATAAPDATIELNGFERSPLRVQLSEDKLTRFGLTPSAVGQLLSGRNLERESDLLDLPLLSAGDEVLRLNDVAAVHLPTLSENQIVYRSGRRAGLLQIGCIRYSDVPRIDRVIRNAIAEEQSQSANVEILLTNDSADAAHKAWMLTVAMALVGLLVGVGLLAILYGLRQSVLAFVVIFGTLGIGVWLYSLATPTMNSLVIAGTLLATAMVVFHRVDVITRFQRSRSRHTAVGTAVVDSIAESKRWTVLSLATAVCLVAPVALLSTSVFNAIIDPAMAVIVIAVLGLVELQSTFAAYLGTARTPRTAASVVVEAPAALFVDSCIAPLIHRRLAVLAVAGAVVLYAAALLFVHAEVRRPPSQDRFFSVKASFAAGTSTQHAREIVDRFLTEEAIIHLPPVANPEYVLVTAAGSDQGGPVVEVLYDLPAGSSPSQLSQRWASSNTQFPVERVELHHANLPVVAFSVSGQDSQSIRSAVSQIEATLSSFEGVINVVTDAPPQIDHMTIEMSNQAQASGLTQADIATAIRDSQPNSYLINIGGRSCPVDVTIEGKSAQPEQMMLQTPAGRTVPLTSVANVVRQTDYSHIHRLNGARATVVYANVLPESAGLVESIRQDVLETISEQPPGISVSVGRQQSSLADRPTCILAVSLSLICLFLLVAAFTGSYLSSIVVLGPAVFALLGAAATHWMIGVDFSPGSILGVACASAICMQGGLHLMREMNARRTTDEESQSIALEACKRNVVTMWSPFLTAGVVMTPLLFVRDVLPVALGFLAGLSVGILATWMYVPCLVITINRILPTHYDSVTDEIPWYRRIMYDVREVFEV